MRFSSSLKTKRDKDANFELVTAAAREGRLGLLIQCALLTGNRTLAKVAQEVSRHRRKVF